MGARILTWLYRRLGSRYPSAFIIAELQTAWMITVGTIVMYTFYYDIPAGDLAPLLATVLALTGATISIAIVRIHRRLRPVRQWIGGNREDPELAARAWSSAVGLPLAIVRHDMYLPIFGVALPGSVVAVAILGLAWTATLPIFAGAMIAIGYSGLLHYFAVEAGMRPVLVDINRSLPPRLRMGVRAFPLRLKLLGSLPLINVITGLIVAALSSNGGGGTSLGFDVLVATAVAFTISFELTALLSRSLLRPIRDLQKATEAVREGRYDHQVPITTADELGELGAAFNQMVAGLAEREQLREAFGTYLDEEVAEYILSEGITAGGRKVDVSILFCDVLGFTQFASEADAQEVVSELNKLFEVIVPIIARHRGHIDKFVGDGLLAVFGAPERLDDHADRAVLAATEIAEAVNGPGSDMMRVGIGVNSGEVVAGSIGGAGRLNFSVIGDAVNVAARVEEATRALGDDVLITAETRTRLGYTVEVAPRGPQQLKGKEEPVELFAPIVRLRQQRGGDGAGIAETIPGQATDGAGLGRTGERPGRLRTLPGR
jgi:class 3 adenylate cyclase